MKRLTLMLVILMSCRRAETPIATTAATPVTVTMPPATVTATVAPTASSTAHTITNDAAPAARIRRGAASRVAQGAAPRQPFQLVSEHPAAAVSSPRVLRVAAAAEDDTPAWAKPRVTLGFRFGDWPSLTPGVPYEFRDYRIRFEMVINGAVRYTRTRTVTGKLSDQCAWFNIDRAEFERAEFGARAVLVEHGYRAGHAVFQTPPIAITDEGLPSFHGNDERAAALTRTDCGDIPRAEP